MKTEWLKINQMIVSWNESEARMGYRAAEQVIRKNITDMCNVIWQKDCITRLFNQSPLSIYVDQMIIWCIRWSAARSMHIHPVHNSTIYFIVLAKNQEFVLDCFNIHVYEKCRFICMRYQMIADLATGARIHFLSTPPPPPPPSPHPCILPPPPLPHRHTPAYYPPPPLWWGGWG